MLSDLIQIISSNHATLDSVEVEEAYSALISQGESAVEPLLTQLQNASHTNRHMLASVLCEILADIGDNDSLALLQYLVNSDDNAIFSPAVGAIARLDVPQIDEVLSQLLCHPAPQVRRVVAWQLGRNQAQSVLMPMIDCLSESDIETLRGLIWSLGRIGDRRALDNIRTFLNHPQDDIAYIAQEAIDRIESTTTA